MDKITYLAELAEGLARWVPERERQDILRYYAEYFEEAGPEREAEVMAELGDPWALSCRLAVEGGYVTHEKAVSWAPGKKRTRFLVGAAVGLSVFALVFGFGMLVFNLVGIGPMRSFAVAVDPMSEYEFVQVLEGSNVAFVDGSEYTDFFFRAEGSLDSFNSIDVDVALGNIEVVAGDDYTLSIGRNNSLTGYEPTWEVTNGVLRLRDGDLPRQAQVDSWDDLKKLFNVNHWSIEVVITVPEGAALDNINVETGVGDVLLWGVNAKTVTAETGVGNVECYEARSVRWMELNTGVGDVGLILEEALDGLNVRLESGTGNVEATLCGAEKDYSYELESGLGLVTVNGVVRGSNAERKGNAPYRLVAESGTGGVNLYFTFG